MSMFSHNMDIRKKFYKNRETGKNLVAELGFCNGCWWSSSISESVMLSYPVVLTGPSPLLVSVAGRKYHDPSVWIVAERVSLFLAVGTLFAERVYSLAFPMGDTQGTYYRILYFVFKVRVSWGLVFASTILLSVRKQKARAWTYVLSVARSSPWQSNSTCVMVSTRKLPCWFLKRAYYTVQLVR